MVKFFKTKKEIDDEYAAALLGLQQTLQTSLSVAQPNDDNRRENTESTSASALFLINNVNFVSRELHSIVPKIQKIVATNPDTKPLMTRALTALKNAAEDSSAKNIRELLWISLAVSRKGDVCKGLSASMTGIGLSLWVTSIIVAAAVASAIALPITFGVGTALILGGVAVFLCGAQYLASKDWDQSKDLASGIKDIRTILSSK